MVALGMILGWVGYSLGLEGWCLFRDYDVTLGQLMSPVHPYAGPWPPAKIPSGQTWPGKATSTAATTAAPQQAAAPGGIVNDIKNLPGIKAIRTITGT